jgi:UDPglucose 6-dehydrogenase
MFSRIDHESDSEAISSTRSSVPTSPGQSLDGTDGLDDGLDVVSSGTRTTVGDDSDPDTLVGPRPIRSICCVGAGYVGTLPGSMILICSLVSRDPQTYYQ